jgi:FkbM family methyltransferase
MGVRLAAQPKGRARATAIANILIRKARSALDRPHSWLELRETSIGFRAPLTYIERTIFRELRALLSDENMIVVDIGAGEGTYTSVFAKTSRVSAVYAFEPAPATFAKLVHAVSAYPQVRCFNIALGDANGRETLYEYSDSSVSSLLEMEERQERLLPSSTVSSETTVDVMRLDDLVDARAVAQPDLIKIDVQGFEDRVLRGAESSLKRTRYCVIELSFVSMYKGSLLFDEIYEQMRDKGFRLVGVAGPIAGPLGAAPQIDGVFRNEEA